MAFTVTFRGYDFKTASSANSVSDTFTPAAGSLLICVCAGAGGGDITSISGHVTWTRVYNRTWTTSSSRHTELWAGIVGGSPSSGQITVVNGYESRITMEFYEITGADTSGTTAAAFGVSAGRDDYRSVTTNYTLTVPAFSSSSNMTFAWANTDEDSGQTFTWSDGTFTTGTKRSGNISFQAAWLLSEDNSVVVAMSPAFQDCGMDAIEIKLASAGGSSNGAARHYYLQQG